MHSCLCQTLRRSLGKAGCFTSTVSLIQRGTHCHDVKRARHHGLAKYALGKMASSTSNKTLTCPSLLLALLPQGFNKQGYNSDGFDTTGFDKDGVDKCGFDKQGLNKDGFDR